MRRQLSFIIAVLLEEMRFVLEKKRMEAVFIVGSLLRSRTEECKVIDCSCASYI